MPTTEERLVLLEERLGTVEGRFPTNAMVETLEGHPHLSVRFRRIGSVSDLPATLNQPGLFYIDSDPLALYIVDSDGRHELGWSAAAAATANLTLTTSFQDITGPHATDGVAVDLPVPGAYVIIGTFMFQRIGDGGVAFEGQLDIGGTAQAELARNVGLSGEHNQATQSWRITTTANDTIAKLQARKTAGIGSSVVLATHTTIVAATFLGGASSAASHQHSHTTLTSVGTDDHHSEGHDVSLHSDSAGAHKTVTFYSFGDSPDQFVEVTPT